MARGLLAFAGLEAAGNVIGTAYSAHLVKESTPAWGWPVILLLQGIAFATFIVIFMVCALFPDGKYQRPYERRMAVTLRAAVPVLVVMQLIGSARLTYSSSYIWQNSVSARNPVAVPALAGLGAVAAVAIQAGIAALLLGVAVLIARYRRFGPAERRQIAWPLYGLALTGCAIVVLGAAHAAVNGFPGWLQYALYLPVLLLIPAGLVIGILRYRLLDIDLVVRRSVVYGVLWLLIAAAYAGVAAALGVVAGRRVPLDLAIVLTIVATMVAAPVRRRLERLADRLVFGRRLSGYELISQLGTRLEASPGPEDVASTVAAAVRLGLGARWVRVSLGQRGERPVASAGIALTAPDDPVLHVPLVHGPDVVGAIDCGLLDAVRERAARLPIAAEVRSGGLPPEARFGPDIEGSPIQTAPGHRSCPGRCEPGTSHGIEPRWC